jgi:hypothetical protein
MFLNLVPKENIQLADGFLCLLVYIFLTSLSTPAQQMYFILLNKPIYQLNLSLHYFYAT